MILAGPDLEFRDRHIMEALLGMNLTCKMIYFSNKDVIKLSIRGALYSNERCDKVFAVEKGFAWYLKEKYTPKIIFQGDDRNYISAIIKKISGATLINIAHCVSCPTANFNVFDYHYYLLFGKSSVENLKKIPVSYGKTKIVMMGSLYLHDKNENKMVVRSNDPIFFFSSQWLAPSIKEDINWVRQTINKLIKRNPNWKFIIKLHPVEVEPDWVFSSPNVRILERDVSYRDALQNVNFHLTHHSAFTLESSVCNIPTICIQRKSFKETCLLLKDFFPVIENLNELESILKQPNLLKWKTVEFVDKHLVNIGKEMEYFISIITSILSDSEVSSDELAGTYYD
jgi:hypothetical protein